MFYSKVNFSLQFQLSTLALKVVTLYYTHYFQSNDKSGSAGTCSTWGCCFSAQHLLSVYFVSGAQNTSYTCSLNPTMARVLLSSFPRRSEARVTACSRSHSWSVRVQGCISVYWTKDPFSLQSAMPPGLCAFKLRESQALCEYNV